MEAAMNKKKVRIPIRLNATLRAARKADESSIALEAARLSPIYSQARRRALNVALDLAKSVSDARCIYQFANPDSWVEHRAVLRWAEFAKTESELIEVLNVARGLKRSGRMERRIMRKLRPFGYRDWWKKVGDFFRSFSLVRKPA